MYRICKTGCRGEVHTIPENRTQAGWYGAKGGLFSDQCLWDPVIFQGTLKPPRPLFVLVAVTDEGFIAEV